MFDMFDTRQRGFVYIFIFDSSYNFFMLFRYLPREKIELLFASLFELIGYPKDEQIGANISQKHIENLIQIVDESTNKRLSRERFMNIENINWIDGNNGIGILHIEHSC